MKETANGSVVLQDSPRDYAWLDAVLVDCGSREELALGIDVETRTTRRNAKAPDARRDELVGAGLGILDSTTGESLPIYGLATDGYIAVLQRRLPGLGWWAFNAMFDATVLRRYGIRLGEHRGDARIIAYLLGEPDAALKPLLQRWLDYDTEEYESILEEWGADDISQVPVEVQADYCALQDAVQCVRLERLMRAELPERSARVYTDIELPMVNVLVEMSEDGIRFDRELGAQMLAEDRHKREQLDSLIAALVKQQGFVQYEKRNGDLWYPTCKSCHNGKNKRQGCLACGGAGRSGPVEKPFNPGSAQQIREWLYDFHGAPVRRWTDSGEPATDKLALLQLRQRNEVVPMILARSKWAKREGFEEKWMELSAADGRLHTTFTNTTVVSGRLSSREPNLQQVTKDLRVLLTADP